MEDTALADPSAGRELTRDELEALVVEMVRQHADGLLRLARRHSLCADDAQDAYQRGLEIFLRHAPRLDPERAPSWLRTVVKHEAMAVRSSRQRDVGPVEVDLDLLEARDAPSPEERVIGFERVARSAEALRRLKPQEVRALWLRAQGNSYDEIRAQTGWTRTKVNRCLYEGRRSFLARYAGIESGEECRRWEPVLSALVDGEATTEELVELRPHLRHCASCRAVMRELHRSSMPLAVVFPAGAAFVAADHAEPASHLFLKVYEAATSWLGERAASSFVRAQMLVEAPSASAAKMTAVAASAAAVAGGGAVAMEQAARPLEGATRAAVAARPRPAAANAPGASSPDRVPAVRARHVLQRAPAITGGVSRAPTAAAPLVASDTSAVAQRRVAPASELGLE